MKRVGDERARINGVNIHPFGGIRPSTTLHFSNSQMDSVRHGLVDVSISGKGRSSAPEQDIRDHPAFETIRSIGRLVAIHTPDVLVSARDVDSVRSAPWPVIDDLCAEFCCSLGVYSGDCSTHSRASIQFL